MNISKQIAASIATISAGFGILVGAFAPDGASYMVGTATIGAGCAYAITLVLLGRRQTATA